MSNSGDRVIYIVNRNAIVFLTELQKYYGVY